MSSRKSMLLEGLRLSHFNLNYFQWFCLPLTAYPWGAARVLENPFIVGKFVRGFFFYVFNWNDVREVGMFYK